VTTLLSIEARRYLARRLVRFLVGLAVLGIVLAGSILFATSHRPSPGRRQAQVERLRAERSDALQACVNGQFGIPRNKIPQGMTLSQFCDQVVVQSAVPDPRFHLTSLRHVYQGTNAILIALFLVLGASFIGAEWHAGTMTTLLTWEPRRVRVFAAKVLAAAAAGFVGLAVLQALLGAALAPAAVVRGSTAGANAAWLRSVAGLVLRGGALAALASAVGCALASVGRNTAAALGVGFAYIAVIEPILRAVKPRWQPWFLYDNAATFLLGHRAGFTVVGRSPTSAGLVLGVYVLAALLAAGAMFVRRDVA